jgi:hypothetical protein
VKRAAPEKFAAVAPNIIADTISLAMSKAIARFSSWKRTGHAVLTASG